MPAVTSGAWDPPHYLSKKGTTPGSAGLVTLLDPTVIDDNVVELPASEKRELLPMLSQGN